MLYLVATPLGNLKDITLRALEVLKACDYILCEDTRHSRVLLEEYQIDKPLKSFHQFNEKEMEEKVTLDLKNGKEIALISDAGTPGICDPGEALVKRCYAENLPFTAIPGPSAWVMALALCPFTKEHVQFIGFTPKKEEERKRLLASTLTSSATTIFYESPHRLVDSLQALQPTRKVCIMRELTKKFEEHRLGTASEIAAYYEKNPPKGEIVVIVEGSSQDYSSLSPEEHVKFLEKEYAISTADAIKIAAELRGVPKRDIYNLIHKK
ncbi:MAG TPA: 16S rRNA (cytidine(1402)-2'-O)-methyltransferase [Rhabdochlamydiaceae bacterium]|nr:16S rRNA (cytidine(1402)-2'-O)-methyltransferase [Rhabdochlamydiaceae bacterium]